MEMLEHLRYFFLPPGVPRADSAREAGHQHPLHPRRKQGTSNKTPVIGSGCDLEKNANIQNITVAQKRKK